MALGPAWDGPIVVKGWEAALGSAAGTSSPTGAPNAYVSGTSDNPDAGPSVYYDGIALKDAYYRYQEGGGSLSSSTGYKNQALGFISNEIFCADFVPATASNTNITSALQAPTQNIPLTLVAASGAGITVEAASQVILNTGLPVPAGVLRIDAAPTWTSFGTSGAIRGWDGAAVGRLVSLTSAGGQNLSGVNFTLRGYDIYGVPFTSTIAGPNGSTVTFPKAAKWVASITPSATSAAQLTAGTADIFEFPLRIQKAGSVLMYWNDTLLTALTTFTAADLNPPTVLTGDVRGTVGVPSGSDGVKSMQLYLRLGPGRLNTNPPATGMFGNQQV